MRIDELTKPELASIPKWMKERGWALVGNGAFANVYSKVSVPYVLKVFSIDDGYLAFLKVAMRAQNVHFPRFRGKLVKISNHRFAVRMEVLEPITAAEYKFEGNGIGAMISNYHLKSLGLRHNNTAANAAERFFEQNPTFKEAIDLIIPLVDVGVNLDLHSSNIMKRADGTLVIIDPLCED